MIKPIVSVGFLVALAAIGAMQGFFIDKGDLDAYIPFTLHAFDPTLFRNDLLIRTIPDHPVFIWKFLGAVLHVVPLKPLFGMLFFFQTALILVALVLFYRTFFGNDTRGIALFLVCMIVATSTPAFGRMGINPYGYFHASAVAMACALIVFVCIDKEMYCCAGALAGGMFLFHPITATFASMVFFSAFALRLIEKRPTRSLILGCVALLAVASPSLIQHATGMLKSHGEPFDLEFWRTVMEGRMAHGFFISKWVPERFIEITAMLLAVFFIRRTYPVKRLLPIAISAVTVIAICIVADLFTIRLFLQLQLGRQLLFAWIIGYAAAAYSVSRLSHPGAKSLKENATYVLWVVFAAYCAYGHTINHYHGAVRGIIIAGIIAAAASAVRFRIRWEWPAVFMSLCIPALAIASVQSFDYFSHKNDFPDSVHNPWRQVQEWCLRSTPKDAVIMVPMYREGFRCYSRRAIFVSYKDGAPHNFTKANIPEWLRRMQALGISLPFKGDEFPSLYHSRCLSAAREEGIRYVVVECALFPIQSASFAYRNSVYGVIDMREFSN